MSHDDKQTIMEAYNSMLSESAPYDFSRTRGWDWDDTNRVAGMFNPSLKRFVTEYLPEAGVTVNQSTSDKWFKPNARFWQFFITDQAANVWVVDFASFGSFGFKPTLKISHEKSSNGKRISGLTSSKILKLKGVTDDEGVFNAITDAFDFIFASVSRRTPKYKDKQDVRAANAAQKSQEKSNWLKVIKDSSSELYKSIYFPGETIERVEISNKNLTSEQLAEILAIIEGVNKSEMMDRFREVKLANKMANL